MSGGKVWRRRYELGKVWRKAYERRREVVAMEPVKVRANSATMANVIMKMIMRAPSISLS
jgi:hypothetical protein